MSDYNVLKTKFINFYQNDAKNLLKIHNKKRKKLLFYLSNFVLSFFCFFVAFLCQNLKFQILGNIFSIIAVISMLSLAVFCIFTREKIGYNVSNKDVNPALESETDGSLKIQLMDKFLEIFGDFKFSKYNYSKSAKKRFKKFFDNPIFPKILFYETDDSIKGSYQDTKIQINEINISFFLRQFMVLYVFELMMAGVCLCADAPVGVFVFLLPLIVQSLFYIVFDVILASNFKGIVIEFDFLKKFKGETILFENKLTNRALKIFHDYKKYEEIKLEDVQFEKKYKIFSTSQIESRYILTPSFMEKLKNIKLAFRAKYIRAYFNKNKLVLLCHSKKDLFQMGNIFKNSDEKMFLELFEQIKSVLDMALEIKEG